MEDQEHTWQGAWIGKKVLVVDDSPLMQEQISHLYEKMGLQVVGVCENGVQALESYNQLKPDLISLDIIMPEMHGLECYRELLKINKSLKCLFISCLGANQSFLGNLKQEIPTFLFINKPAQEDALEQGLQKVFT
jgi:two-component system chemotaxis response regulator CheY